MISWSFGVLAYDFHVRTTTQQVELCAAPSLRSFATCLLLGSWGASHHLVTSTFALCATARDLRRVMEVLTMNLGIGGLTLNVENSQKPLRKLLMPLHRMLYSKPVGFDIQNYLAFRTSTWPDVLLWMRCITFSLGSSRSISITS